MKNTLLLTMAVLLCCCMTGCGINDASTDAETNTSTEDSYSIVFDGAVISAAGNVSVDGTTATITSAGTYEISGTLDNGQLIVETSGNVILILNNASIHCSTSSPIYIKEAGQVTITLADGSSNSISDGAEYVLAAAVTEPDAALYSKSDMVINGSGTLTVTANYNDGITSKDTLLIESGTIHVAAINHGIKGKDYLIIDDGVISVNAGGDGIKSTNDTEVALGYLTINGGELTIVAADEGISAIGDVTIADGTIFIETANNGVKTDAAIIVSGGSVDIQTADDGLICSEQSISDEASVTVNGESVKSS